MRITAAEKEATRKRILSAAKSLFRSKGFETATARDIAREVGIASGTMFNYFRTKEAIVVEVAAHGLARAHAEFESQRAPDKSTLEEQLFSSIATQLRCLRPLRKYVRPFVDTVLTPLPPTSEPEATLRAGLHEHFIDLLTRHVCAPTEIRARSIAASP